MLVPLRVLGPLVPILVIAKATPLASTRAAIVVANSNIARLIIYPSLSTDRLLANRFARAPVGVAIPDLALGEVQLAHHISVLD